ncbi:hypothetical protein L1987_53005 [Smallanthus sonchifolius]|uniref:Uncharacterized protein n=1 Tax=Smallanthus sonchifolius TaxID=185202 RepID=A0ACB9EVI2_9ASTR|nr:hypothetical protein L1987_53005 [Smallanthus sonchifolius]
MLTSAIVVRFGGMEEVFESFLSIESFECYEFLRENGESYVGIESEEVKEKFELCYNGRGGKKQSYLYSTTHSLFTVTAVIHNSKNVVRIKYVAADCLKAIRRKLVPADNLKQSVANSLLLMIRHMACTQQLEAAMYYASTVEVNTQSLSVYAYRLNLSLLEYHSPSLGAPFSEIHEVILSLHGTDVDQCLDHLYLESFDGALA